MPNQRAPDQKLLPFAVSEKFIRELDAALAQTGYRNRSQFIRDAIIEKLARAGVVVPPELALPPRRTGKTARPAKSRYPEHRPSPLELNERAEGRSRAK